MVVVGVLVADFEEEGGLVDFQSVDVQIIKEYLFGKEGTVHLWQVGIDEVELLFRQSGFDVVERLAEGGLFFSEVAEHHGQVEQLAAVGFEQTADAFVVV